MSAYCAQCKGRSTTADPLHVMQVMESPDRTLRLLLHERCIGTWTLRNRTQFIRSDEASYPDISSAALCVGVQELPSCAGGCGAGAAGIFIHWDANRTQTIRSYCGACGFIIRPSSSKRLLALYDIGAAPGLSAAKLSEILEDLGLAVELGAGFGKVRGMLVKLTSAQQASHV